MFKSQTKDKQLIDELKQKNHEQFMEACKQQQQTIGLLDEILELKEENAKLKAKISYLENPFPYELSVSLQRQQLAAQKKMDEEKSRLDYIYGLRERRY